MMGRSTIITMHSPVYLCIIHVCKKLYVKTGDLIFLITELAAMPSALTNVAIAAAICTSHTEMFVYRAL